MRNDPQPLERDDLRSIRERLHAVERENTRLREAAAAVSAAEIERERATELANTNSALRRSIARLVERPDLDCFIQQMLADTSAIVEARTTLLFAMDPQRRSLRLVFGVHGDDAVDLEGDDRFEAFREPFALEESCAAHLATEHAREHCTDLDAEPIHPDVKELHRRLGHRSSHMVPLVAGDRVLAILTMCFPHRAEIPPEKLDLVRAWSQQITLALEFVRLNREAQALAVEEERNRMAREIHDTLAQGFSGVIMQVEAAKGALAVADAKAATTHLDRAAGLARSSLTEARRSVRALRPRALAADGLLGAIEGMMREKTLGIPLETEFASDGEGWSLPVEWEEVLLRVTQEALVNAMRHAAAKRFRARLSFGPREVVLELADDGRGFDPNAEHEGYGLIGIKERVDRVGGRVAIESRAGAGTRIEVILATTRERNGHEHHA